MFGKCATTTTHNVVERARQLPSLLPISPHTAQVLDHLKALNPKVIAGHHAPAFTGSALQGLRDLRQALFTGAAQAPATSQ